MSICKATTLQSRLNMENPDGHTCWTKDLVDLRRFGHWLRETLDTTND